MSKYVIYEDRRYRVAGTETIDGREYYQLETCSAELVALPEECIPDDRPRVRRFKHDGYILEFEPDSGIVWIRRPRQRRSDSNRTSLAAIFSMTTKAHVALQKSLRAAKRRAKGGKR